MKTKIYFYLITLSIMLGMTSCEIAEPIDSYSPYYSYVSETAINTEGTAELALAGNYTGFYRSPNLTFANEGMALIPSIFSGVTFASYPRQDLINLENFDIQEADNSRTGNAYPARYTQIANCNWVIKSVSDNLTDADFAVPSRRKEIIAEAKTIRATSYMYLLFLYGQFYDVNSIYGVTIRDETNITSDALPRNTVAEVYDFILSDLDYAIANASNTRPKYYINSTYAKALKAKIKLFMGAYAEAATLASEVINNSGGNYGLLPTYAEIFDHKTPVVQNNNELLFLTKPNANEKFGFAFYTTFAITATPSFYNFATTGTMNVGGQLINYDSNRISDIFTPARNDNKKYIGNNQADIYDGFYHMRMAEVYLILAEANARANNGVTATALNALNTIRVRAGATTTGGNGFETYPATIPLNQFLEAVRIEKVIELATENGIEWYDLVRYAYMDGGFNSGFKVSDVNPKATNPDRFILPIYEPWIIAGGNVVEQNPGY